MQQKYTVITGASSGIGRSIAKEFANKSKNLILIARRKNLLEELKLELLSDNPNIDIVIKDFDLTNTHKLSDLYFDTKQYFVETWINNAGIGLYENVNKHSTDKIQHMLSLNIEALTILSILYTKDYYNTENAQLINISSAGGYTIVPTATVYCATKFYVSSFTEGLSRELKLNNYKLRAKVLAPAATKTEFGNIANNITDYDYDKSFGTYHTAKEMAIFLIKLYESQYTLGYVNRETFEFILSDGSFNHSYNSNNNQIFSK